MEDIKKLVIGKMLDSRYVSTIQEMFPWLNISLCETREEQEEFLRDADILFTRMLPMDPSMYPKLKWVHFMWEGIDGISEELKGSDVLLTNSRGIHSHQIAEHVFMYMLVHSRKVFDYRKNQEKRFWLPWKDQPLIRTLKDSTIGIIGYGAIGREIARIAKGFGMRVVAMKREPGSRVRSTFPARDGINEPAPPPDKVLGQDALNELLSESDHVVLALPLTEETRNFMGEAEFENMKKGAFFMNIGRGALVDEDSLIKSLENGHISGAGLDVFRDEPLPGLSPLWSMENVILTPHSSVGGDPADERVVELFCENLDRFLKGKEMINLVDKKKGY